MTKINLTQKERMLLEDQKSHEKICIEKYTNYAEQANDPQLKQLFNTLASEEEEHYDTINQILSGTVPNMNQKGQENKERQKANFNSGMNTSTTGMVDTNDASICSDLLMTEKYISGTYDTTIFECVDTSLRDVLNHIQKEEQQHGEDIFNYMQSKGMYEVK